MDITEKILKLKEERNAVILAHNYQLPEVQDIADFTGDSLELSRKAAETDADIILFCGVYFMAETAKILSPQKMVLIPDETAGCPMADMVDEKKLLELKKQNPEAVVVSYVNTTARVKALSDVCCTSANAQKVLEKLKGKKIIFVPDKHLGEYASKKAGVEVILYNGFCPIHERILKEHIEEKKRNYPKAKVIIHPECFMEVCEIADEVTSTSGMLKYAKGSFDKEFIIGTEIGLLHPLKKQNPEKDFYPASEIAVCENMKKTTLEKVLWSLEDLKFEVEVPEEIREKAKLALDKMLEII